MVRLEFLTPYYDWYLFVHVAATVAVLATSVGNAVRLSLLRDGHLLSVTARTFGRIDRLITAPSYLLLLISGILLILAVGWPLQAWLIAGVALYVGAVMVTTSMLAPVIRTQLSFATGIGSAGYVSAARRSRLSAWLVVALLAVATWLMMAKPALSL